MQAYKGHPITSKGQKRLIAAIRQMGRQQEERKGWPKNSVGVRSVLTEQSLTLFASDLAKHLDQLGYEIKKKGS